MFQFLANPPAVAARRHSLLRHAFYRTAVLAISPLVVFASLFLLAQQAGAASTDRPNIIFIMADDLGYGDLGCYGQTKIKTPHLDQMAAEGMKFTQFYAGSTVCAPARCVLMTGLHTGHCYIRGNGRINLRPEDVTVAEVLKQRNYQTALIGKWGLGNEGSVGVPTRQGFDYFFGYLDQGHAHNYYPAYLMRNEKRFPLRNVVEGVVEGVKPFGVGYAVKRVDYSHDLLAEEALQWIDQNKAKPFFLYLALTIPHANNQRNRALGDGQEVPDYGIYADLDWTDPNKGQAAMITRMDRDIGRIFARLKQHGIDDNTLVMFTSDNGHHREGGNNPEFFNANGPLRGKKRDLYEGGIRVPTLARWPGKIKPGVVTDHIAYFGDFMATAADLANVKPPAKLDSISFLPTLLGRPQEKHEYLYWEFYEGAGGKQAVRMGDWKGVRIPAFSGKMQLFDLGQDLGEEHDLATEHADIVKQIEAIMQTAHHPSPLWKVRKPRKKKPKKAA